MTRKEVLRRAEACVCGQRETDYGSPEDNFRTIAGLWTAYKGAEFTPVDVAMMMALLKVARIKSGDATDDSFVDLAGYAACGGEICSVGRTKNRHATSGPTPDNVSSLLSALNGEGEGLSREEVDALFADGSNAAYITNGKEEATE